ncbi:hypothetical protein AB837_00074 [bacterium AB1]|nr:hypothetical protein AB837_00074 [bacterium AB1]
MNIIPFFIHIEDVDGEHVIIEMGVNVAHDKLLFETVDTLTEEDEVEYEDIGIEVKITQEQKVQLDEKLYIEPKINHSISIKKFFSLSEETKVNIIMDHLHYRGITIKTYDEYVLKHKHYYDDLLSKMMSLNPYMKIFLKKHILEVNKLQEQLRKSTKKNKEQIQSKLQDQYNLMLYHLSIGPCFNAEEKPTVHQLMFIIEAFKYKFKIFATEDEYVNDELLMKLLTSKVHIKKGSNIKNFIPRCDLNVIKSALDSSKQLMKMNPRKSVKMSKKMEEQLIENHVILTKKITKKQYKNLPNREKKELSKHYESLLKIFYNLHEDIYSTIDDIITKDIKSEQQILEQLMQLELTKTNKNEKQKQQHFIKLIKKSLDQKYERLILVFRIHDIDNCFDLSSEDIVFIISCF